MTSSSIFSALQKLRILLSREDKIKCLAMICFALCTSLFEVLTASVIVIFAQVLNRPETGQKYLGMVGLGTNLSPSRAVFYLAIIVGMVYLIKNLIAMAEVFHQNFSIQNMNYRFKNKLLYRYAEADYGFYLTRNSALGLQVVGGDTEQIFSSGMIAIASVLSESMVFLCLLVMVIYMNSSLALVIFGIGVVLSVAIIKGLFPMFYRFGERLQEASLYCGQNLLQFFHAFKEVILLGKREAFVNAYQYHSHKKANVQAIQMAVNSLPRMVIEILFISLFVTTIALLCLQHESPMQIIGVLSGYLYAGFRLMPGLNRIISQLNTFKYIIPSIERVYQEYTSIAAKETYVDVPSFQFKNKIILKDIRFRYLNTKRDALTKISLEIEKGECIGIIGETGSGKSTLVDIILGLLKPYKGSIFIDGKFTVNCYQWHKQIGYVPQSLYLIDDTIEANIAFGEKIIDETRVNSVIEAAQLYSFIKQLPNGVKTIVGERGIRLSGGERQRIAIARALYRNPEVLIFDEATSALDNETERKLMDTINKVSHNRTVIMVAHRLTTLRNCSRIVIMAEGKIKNVMAYDVLQHTKICSNIV